MYTCVYIKFRNVFNKNIITGNTGKRAKHENSNKCDGNLRVVKPVHNENIYTYLIATQKLPLTRFEHASKNHVV